MTIGEIFLCLTATTTAYLFVKQIVDSHNLKKMMIFSNNVRQYVSAVSEDFNNLIDENAALHSRIQELEEKIEEKR